MMMLWLPLKNNVLFSKKVRRIILLMLLITPFLHHIAITESAVPIRLNHIVIAVLFFANFFYSSQNMAIIKKYLILTGIMYAQTFIAYCFFGIHKWVLNLILCTLAMFTSWWLSDDFTQQDWFAIGKIYATVSFCGYILHLFVHKGEIWSFLLNPIYAHPIKGYLLSGEDASWLGLSAFFAANSALWMPIIALTFVFSIFTNSRGGLLTAFCFVLWISVQYIRKKFGKNVKVLFWSNWSKTQKIISMLLTVLIILTLVVAQSSALEAQREAQTGSDSAKIVQAGSYLLNRVRETGNEPGSLGRLRMWKWVPQESKENILGYGLGNGTNQIKENDPQIYEINLHNIYLQVLLDQGVIGFTILILVIAKFVLTEIPSLFSNPIAAFILCYLGLGVFQFTFLDVFFWIIVGGYLNLEKRKKIES